MMSFFWELTSWVSAITPVLSVKDVVKGFSSKSLLGMSQLNALTHWLSATSAKKSSHSKRCVLILTLAAREL